MALRRVSGNAVPRRTVDLKEVLLEISEEFDLGGASIYLFGSRRYRSGSARSDIDLLVESPRALSTEDAARLFAMEPYLDVFEMTGGEARSLINESRLRAAGRSSLIEMLDAIPLFVEGDWQPDADEFILQEVLDQRNPAATMLPLYDLYDAIPAERADILVVTALTKEYEAVVQALGLHPVGESTVRTEVDGWLVTVRNLNEMGSVGAALGTRGAMLRTKAAHVVLVGICAGIPGKVEIGDVVLPRTVIYFESGKVSTGRFSRRGRLESADDQRHCDPGVLGRAALCTPPLRKEGITLYASDDVMACGEKVVASKWFRDNQIRFRHRKISAIDMESYGVARAAAEVKRKLTVIKGVCDMADHRKNDGAHTLAAENAANVLVALIERGAFGSD